MTKRIGVGLLALGLLLSFLAYSHSTPAQAAALTEQQIRAITSLIASFGASAETVANVSTALRGQAGGSATVGSAGGSVNQRPIGYAGNIRGGIAHGWTLDPDEPSAKIGFHVYIDGPVGKGGTYVAGGRAGQNRSDITAEKTSYGHWYEFVIPDEYRDGTDHTLYIYGIDSQGVSGNNFLLKNNPKSFNIAPGSVPPLFIPGDRVKTTANLNARATPSIKGVIVGAEPKGSLGTIVSGPTNAGGYTWWQIDYDNNITGWSADTYLMEVSTPPSEDPSCTLSATPSSISSGGSATLAWTSINATSGTIDQGVGTMTPIAGGTKTVSPTQSTLYTATVTGTGGSATCDANVDVTTGGDTTKPTVSLTAPADGATVSGTVTLSADASDNVGVVSVRFKVDGANVGAEDTTAPYSISWNSTTAIDGMHTVRAVARDAAGNTRWSAVRSVTVGNNTAVITSKKGGALANSRMQGHSYTATDILNALNISWYYNWREEDQIHANGVFVPMVWRQDTIDEVETIYQSSSKKFPVLLTFNEPNNPGMASRNPPQVLLTPAEAASYWDRLTAISTRISAPAPSDGPNGGADGSWLDAFMKLTADKGKRVDFVTLHWYGAPDATKFLNDVDALWNKYQRPIWVTEFAVKDSPANPNKYTEDDVINFMKVALRGLEDRPYVEQYAWFGTDGSAGVLLDQSTLFDEVTGELTKVGKFYAAWDPSGTPTFSPGDRIKTTANLNVRATPSGTGVKVGTEPPGALGTIAGGPTINSNTWWQINWDNLISGWSVESYLAKITTPPPPPGTPSCTLSASPTSITSGQSSTLSWTSTNATSGSIDQGAGTMTPIAGGTKTVSPTSSTLYTATVTGGGGSATCSANVAVALASNDVITVQGNQILRNGVPFIMKGVVFESSQYTDADLAVCSSPGHNDEVSCKKRKDSRDYYFGRGAFTSGNDVFSVLPQWGANTIRFNLGQAPLDPQSPYYDAAYVQMVADSVKRARDRGYIVIVSPFAGRNDKAGTYLNSHNPDTPLDSASTLRANETLAGLFKNDRGVILETLNEPYWTHNATGWGYWLNGGTNVGPQGWNFVGVNAVIGAIRATGARNVIIAQGMGANFEGFTGGVIDSQGQLAYSAHPFLNSAPNESDWDLRFGSFAATHPFLITAWGSNTNMDWCVNTATDINRPLEFLNYLKQRNIGVAGWAFDAHGAGSITRDFYKYPGEPSVLGTQCGDNGGVGTLVQQYFLGTLPPPPPTFSPGDRIKTTANLNVRATPSGTGVKVGTEPLGALGTITSGPTVNNNTWWQIDWDNLISGWSVESYLAKVVVPPNLIGPLYVFAGQSNMIGAGTDINQLVGRTRGDTLPGVQIWNNLGNTFENIQLGVNTVQWPQANQVTFDKFGTEWAVAERSSTQSIPAYIVKVARGGSSLLVDAEWDPSASNNLTTKLKDAVSGAKAASGAPLKCFAWIQGEADRGKTASLTEYSNNLKDIVSRVRTVGGNSSAHIAIVELSYPADGSGVSATDSFRAMQQAFVNADPYASLIDTDDLTKVDNVHYDTASIMTLGNRIYNACNNTDTTKPTVSLTAPAGGATVSGTVTISASASDDVGVVGVQFKLDGANVGAEDTTLPYSIVWDSTTATNGTHNIRAVARDAAGNTASTANRSVTVGNNVVATPTIEGPTKSAVDALKGWTVTGGDPSSTFTIDWGDGTAKSQTKTFGEKVWHTYRSGGSYSLTAEVTRPGGAKVTAQAAVAVTPLKYLFCDIKRPVALREWTLSSSNYRQVIDAFKSELGCNGIRFGIDSKTNDSDVTAVAPDSSPEGYTKLYRDAYAYARQKGLLIYANLLPEPDTAEYSSTTKQAMINRVSAYTNHFCPDFLGPFNENPGFQDHSGVVNGVRAQMTSSCTDPAGNTVKAALIVGPDAGELPGVKKVVSGDPAFLGTIDILSSHGNNGGPNTTGGGGEANDRSMTVSDWQELRTLGGGRLPAWASEQAGRWDTVPFAGDHQGEQVGVKAIVDSGVISGLVLYMAPKLLVESGGTYTLATNGTNIAQGLCDAGWDRSCPKVLGASTTRESSLIESIWSYITGTLGAAAAALFNFPF